MRGVLQPPFGRKTLARLDSAFPPPGAPLGNLSRRQLRRWNGLKRESGRAGRAPKDKKTHLKGAEQLHDARAMLHAGLQGRLAHELLQRALARALGPSFAHGLDGDLLSCLAVDGEVHDAVGAVGSSEMSVSRRMEVVRKGEKKKSASSFIPRAPGFPSLSLSLSGRLPSAERRAQDVARGQVLLPAQLGERRGRGRGRGSRRRRQESARRRGRAARAHDDMGLGLGGGRARHGRGLLQLMLLHRERGGRRARSVAAAGRGRRWPRSRAGDARSSCCSSSLLQGGSHAPRLRGRAAASVHGGCGSARVRGRRGRRGEHWDR